MSTARQKVRKQQIAELRQEGRDARDANVPRDACPHRYMNAVRWAEGWWSRDNELAAKVNENRAVLLDEARGLLREVTANFTREDDLPNNLLPRIDEMLLKDEQTQ